jgi:putative ABC transport system permease protein
MVIIDGLMMYTISSNAVKQLKKSVANSITLKTIEVSDKSDGNKVYFYPADYEDVNTYINSPYVYKYNYYDYTYIIFKNIHKFVGNSDDYNKLQDKIGKSNFDYDGTLYGLVESAYDAAFTVYGYTLLIGREITSKDFNQKVCLISEELAQSNNLNIGDIITGSNYKKPINYSLKIIGIFSTPEGEYLTGKGYSPAEIIFTPVSTMRLYLDESGYGESEQHIQNVCVYLKNSSNIDAFIREVQSKMNIRSIYKSHFGNNSSKIPEGFENLTSEELCDYYAENNWYDIQVDEEWYEMVASPIEKVSQMTVILVIGIISSAILILVLINIIILKGKNHEIGILLAIGEGKIKIINQILLEEFSIILIAAFIGLFAGISIGVPEIKSLCDDVYNQQAEEISKDNQNILYNYMQEDQNIGDEGWNHSGSVDLISKSSARIAIHSNIEPKLNMSATIKYTVITLSLVFLVIIIQSSFILRLKPAHILTDRKNRM